MKTKPGLLADARTLLPAPRRPGRNLRPAAISFVLVACIAAGCSHGTAQSVRATGGGGAAAPAGDAGAPTSTTTPPTTAVPVPDPPVTLPPLPVPTSTTRPRPTTTTQHHPATTTPPLSSVRRPAAYAAGQAKPNGPGVVVPITALGTAGTPIPVNGRVSAMVATPDGATVFAANRVGYVTAIDTASSTRRYDVAVCPSAAGIAVSPDGNTVWVTCEQQGTLEPVDLLRRQALDPIHVGYTPGAVVITPDGNTVYVVNYNGTSPSDPEATVVPIDTATRTTGPPIRLRQRREAGAAALTPDGRTLYVLTDSVTSVASPTPAGVVFAIDTATNTIVREFPTSCPAARGIAITGDGTTGYLGCFTRVTRTTLDHYSEPEPSLDHDSRGVALSVDGKTLYSAAWASGFAEIIDPRTMQPCRYVELSDAAAVVAVPGIIPDVPCVKPDG